MKPQLSRPPALRMLKIHQHLQKRAYPNCSMLAKKLEVSVKTVQRDIEYMRDQYQLPLAYDSVKRGYFYTEEVAAFPTVQITEGELLALLVAGKALEQYRGTDYEKQLRTTFDKLAAGLTDKVSFDLDAGFADISFSGTGHTVNDTEVFRAISRAVVERREIEFDYRKPGSTTCERRRIQPYHLAYRDNLCYLIGRDLSKDDLRQFALPRITKVDVRSDRFAVPPDFSVYHYFRGALGAHGGRGDFEVRVRFDAKAAFYIRERIWHSTQTLTELQDGGIDLSLRLSSLDEIERWILSWGSRATVLGPALLLQSTRAELKKMLEKYE